MRWRENTVTQSRPLRIAVDIDDTLMRVWRNEMISEYNKTYQKNLKYEDIISHDFNGDARLREIFMHHFYTFHDSLPLFEDARNILEHLKHA